MRGIGEIGGLLLTVLLATTIILGGGMFYSNLYSHYSVNSSNATSELQIQSANSKLNSSVNSMASTLQSSNTNQNAFTLIFSGASEGVKQVFSIGSVMTDYLGATGAYLAGLGVNVGWFIIILVAVLGAYIVLNMIEVGLGRKV